MRVAGKLSVISGLTAAIVLVVGATSYYSVSTLIAANDWVLHSKSVLQELDLLLYDVTDVVCTQRSYILSGDPAYLEANKSQVAATDICLNNIADLEKTNPEQTERAKKLKSLIKERLASLEVTLNIYKEQGLDAAIQRIKRSSVLQFRIRVRAAIEEMKEYELSLLQHRTADMRQSAWSSQLTVVAGTLLALVFTIVYNFLFGQSILSCIKQLLRASENIKYGRFDLSASTDSNDEFAELGAAFNTLGQQLAVTTQHLANQKKTNSALLNALNNSKEEIDSLQKTISQLALISEDEAWKAAKNDKHHAKLVEILNDLSQLSERLTEFSDRRDDLLHRLELSRERAEHLMISSAARAHSAAQFLETGSTDFPKLRTSLENLRGKAESQAIVNDLKGLSEELIDRYKYAATALETSKISFETLQHELGKQAELCQDLRAIDYHRTLNMLGVRLNGCRGFVDDISKTFETADALIHKLELTVRNSAPVTIPSDKSNTGSESTALPLS
jgi:CHASE3 domain sensor protein